MFWQAKKQFVGVDIGADSIKIVCLEKIQDKIILKNSIIEPNLTEIFDRHKIAKPEELGKRLQNLFKKNKLKTNTVACAVSDSNVFTKKIYVPLTVAKTALRKNISEAAVKCIPYDIRAVCYEYQVLGVTDDLQVEVMVVAVKREIVDNYLLAFGQAGIKPILIDVTCFALENVFIYNYSSAKQQLAVLLDVGQRNVEITVLDRGRPVAYFETSVAGGLYVESLADVFQILPKEAFLIFKGEVDNRYDDNLYRQTITNVTKHIVANIVEKLKKQNFGLKFENIDVIYVTGGCLKVRSLLDELVAKTNLPCLHLYPFKKIMDAAGNVITAELGTQASPFLGVATGLALRLVEKK